MQSACRSYYARMQPAYAGVCRLLQAACILQKSCMRGACVSSSFHFASAFVAVILSQLMASSSALWRLNKPPSSFVIGHESTMCSMVCCSPQSQSGDQARPHLCILARHGPWPVLKRFNSVQEWRGRSKPGCWKMTVDHSSRQPVFFPLRSLVDRSCVCPDRASSYKSTVNWHYKCLMHNFTNSILACFVSRTILVVTDHRQEHIFPHFPPDHS